MAKFRRSSPCQFGARTFLSKNFSEFFVLWSLIVVLSFNCLYLALYYLKVVCTQFFIPRLIISFKILFVFQQFMVCKIVTFNLQTRYYICQNFDRNFWNFSMICIIKWFHSLLGSLKLVFDCSSIVFIRCVTSITLAITYILYFWMTSFISSAASNYTFVCK